MFKLTLSLISCNKDAKFVSSSDRLSPDDHIIRYMIIVMLLVIKSVDVIHLHSFNLPLNPCVCKVINTSVEKSG